MFQRGASRKAPFILFLATFPCYTMERQLPTLLLLYLTPAPVASGLLLRQKAITSPQLGGWEYRVHWTYRKEKWRGEEGKEKESHRDVSSMIPPKDVSFLFPNLTISLWQKPETGLSSFIFEGMKNRICLELDPGDFNFFYKQSSIFVIILFCFFLRGEEKRKEFAPSLW